MDYSLKLMALNKEGCLVCTFKSGITHTRMKCIKMSQNFKCIRKTKHVNFSYTAAKLKD